VQGARVRLRGPDRAGSSTRLRPRRVGQGRAARGPPSGEGGRGWPGRRGVLDGEVREQRVALEDHPEVAPLRRQVRDARAVHEDVARAGLDEPRDDHEQRGLPRARRPEEREELPQRHLERDAVDGGETYLLVLSDKPRWSSRCSSPATEAPRTSTCSTSTRVATRYGSCSETVNPAWDHRERDVSSRERQAATR
jgi:hypothetical protein